jgi:hypothetical protein
VIPLGVGTEATNKVGAKHNGVEQSTVPLNITVLAAPVPDGFGKDGLPK